MRHLDPRHGPHDPVEATPERAPASIRRTTSVDMLRPDGLDGDLVLIGRGRDLLTSSDGAASIVGEATLRITIDFGPERLVRAASSDPPNGCTERLVGTSGSKGFRRRLAEAWPGASHDSSLLYQLLDDTPAATLISGYALSHADTGEGASGLQLGTLQFADMCSGFRRDGTIMLEIGRTKRSPVVTGPRAPSLDAHDDLLAWHDLPPLPTNGMRRRRRLDLEDGTSYSLDTMFRDSHMAIDGTETVLHEYSVAAELVADTLVLTSVLAEPRVLPWQECPSASASAQRLLGWSVVGLRSWVGGEITGTSSCTHLNDHLRSFEAVGGLAAELRRAR